MEILIKETVLNKMFAYADEAKKQFNSEIGGFAHYKNDMVYKLAPLQRQKATAANVDIEPDELVKSDYNMSDMIVQWHSHIDMGVTPSGTDTKNIKESLKLMKSLITIIVNCKRETFCRVDIIDPKFGQLTIKSELVPVRNTRTIDVSGEVKEKLYKDPIIVNDWRGHSGCGEWAYDELGFLRPHHNRRTPPPQIPPPQDPMKALEEFEKRSKHVVVHNGNTWCVAFNTKTNVTISYDKDKDQLLCGDIIVTLDHAIKLLDDNYLDKMTIFESLPEDDRNSPF